MVFRPGQSLLWLTGLLWLFAGPAHAFCFQAAGARYHIDPRLLEAIAVQESSLNPHAININHNKAGRVTSTDYGVMQVNSGHIPELKSMGVLHDRQELLTNPCLNVQIGAWILARHLQTCGVTWRCLGSYNAGFGETAEQERKRMAYARYIYRIYYGRLRTDRP